MLNNRLVTEIMRQRFGWEDDSQSARVLNAIPEALKRTGRTIAADQFLRQLLITPKASTFVPIGDAGRVNLATGYGDYQFLEEYLDKGNIYFLPAAEITGTPSTGTLTIAPDTGTAATGYLTVSVPSARATGTFTLADGRQATGSYNVDTLPNNADTIVVNGVTFTFTTNPFLTPVTMPIMGTTDQQAAVIANRLGTYAFDNPTSGVARATYSAQGSMMGVTYKDYGSAGNAFTIVGNVRVIASGATLTGGSDGVESGESIFVNGVQVIFESGTPTGNILYVGEPEQTAEENTVNLYNALAGSSIPEIRAAAYAITAEDEITVSCATLGAVGNAFPITGSTHITASGTTLSGGIGGIVEGETITINSVAFTFSNFSVGATYIPFSTNQDADESAALLAEFLNASASGSINVATYTTSLPPPDQQTDGDTFRAVKITYDTTGVGGNAYTLANSSGSGVARSGATLTGGVAGTVVNNETLDVNGFTVTFKSSAGAFPEVQIGATPTITATNLAAGLNASLSGLLTNATYSSEGPVVTITFDTYGTAGDSFTLAYSSLFGVIPSGPALSGGTGGADVDDSSFTIGSFLDYFHDLDRVRFTSTGQFPPPLDADIDYYIINYEQGETSATFQLSTTADGLTPLVLTDIGTGVLTVMKFEGNDNPLQQVASAQQSALPVYLDSVFDFFVVQGNVLTVLPIDDVTPVGQCSFAVPAFPTTVENLPDSEEAEVIFLDTLAELIGMPMQAAV